MEKQSRRTFSEIFENSNQVSSSYRIVLRRKFKEIGFDLTLEMVQVLDLLWKEDRQSQQSLANQLTKDKVSITYLIDNLSKRQLVTRKMSESDKRVKLICLTAEGKAMKEPIQDALQEVRGEIIGNIGLEQMKVVLDYYGKVTDNLAQLLKKLK